MAKKSTDLILILGPMKSGKSFELINYFSPLKHTDISYALYQPLLNVRDENIKSRNGAIIESKKVKSLAEALDKNSEIVGVDEIHMFKGAEIKTIECLLKKGARIIASGLDTDYRGRMFGIVKKLLELGPEEVIYKRAVCEICKKPEAIYTQIFKELECRNPILKGLPAVVPEDGTFYYKPVCRNCFIKIP